MVRIHVESSSCCCVFEFAAMPPRGVQSADHPELVFVECLRCGHRAVLGHDVLDRFGVAPDVTVVELSRSLVCQECGSRSTRAFRGASGQAKEFAGG